MRKGYKNVIAAAVIGAAIGGCVYSVCLYESNCCSAL